MIIYSASQISLVMFLHVVRGQFSTRLVSIGQLLWLILLEVDFKW